MSFFRSQRCRNAFWWLALALVLAPALGRMHQVVHGLGDMGPGQRMAQAVTAAGSADAAPAIVVLRARQAMDVVHELFASHAGADCQLLDQQLLGGILPVAAHSAPLVYALPHALPACRAPVGTRARRLWACLARAPPAQA